MKTQSWKMFPKSHLVYSVIPCQCIHFCIIIFFRFIPISLLVLCLASIETISFGMTNKAIYLDTKVFDHQLLFLESVFRRWAKDQLLFILRVS